MKNNFQIIGLDQNLHNNLFHLNENELAAKGAIKMKAEYKPGFPCRVSLQDAEVGEEVILLPFEHHAADSPYKASGPIFIRKNAATASLKQNEIPVMLNHRQLSLRGYNSLGMMLEGVTIHGEILRFEIQKLFENQEIAYIQIHNAGPGCFNCQVNRVI